MTDTTSMPDAETTHVTNDESGHGHDSDGDAGHAASEPLGPVDLTAWAYAIAGSALGILVVLALYVARGA